MPPDDSLGFMEECLIVVWVWLAVPELATLPRSQVVDDAIVEFGEREVQLGDDVVFVVAWVPSERGLSRANEVVLIEASAWRCRVVRWAGLNITLPKEQLRVVAVVVEVRCHLWARPVQRIQIEPRRSEVSDGVRVVLLLEARSWVEGDIMVDELAENPKSSRDISITDCSIVITHWAVSVSKRHQERVTPTVACELRKLSKESLATDVPVSHCRFCHTPVVHLPMVTSHSLCLSDNGYNC